MKSRRLTLLLAIAILLWAPFAVAQSQRLRFERLTPDDGLPHDNVYAITQDRNGFLWFATEDGLTRYDGETFRVFAHDRGNSASIAASDISTLAMARDGTMWLATWGEGLDRFDPVKETFTHYRHRRGDLATLSDDRVQSVHEARSGDIWIGTRAAGLCQLDPKSGRVVRYRFGASSPSALRGSRVWSILEAPDGTLWVGTDKGLDRLDPRTGRFRRFDGAGSLPAALEGHVVRSLAYDRAGALWIGTRPGLFRLSKDEAQLEEIVPAGPEEAAALQNTINTVYEDRRGTVWIGTDGAGLYRYDTANGKFSRSIFDPYQSSSVSSNDIRALFEDASGILWVGTRGGAISRVDLKPAKFTTWLWDPADTRGLGGRGISTILEDRYGTLWIGTRQGLDRRNPGTDSFVHYVADGKRGSLADGDVEFLVEDHAARFWVGLYRAGLCLFDRANGQCVETWRQDGPPGRRLSDDSVRSLMEARDGELWIGTAGGLDRLDPRSGKVTTFHNDPADPQSLSDNYVLTVVEDRRGRLWVGTDSGGLNLLDRKTGKFTSWRRDSTPGSLSSDRVRVVFEDRAGNLWIGTSTALQRFDPLEGTFESVPAVPPLRSANIEAILEDRDGKLWISTANGLSMLDPRTMRSRSYTTSDGLQSNVFYPAAACRARDGRFYFGGTAGVSSFVPGETKDNEHVPPIAITNFRVLTGLRSTTRPAAAGGRIDLPYDQNFFTIEFAALDYTAPAANRYSYRLEGVDRAWIDPGPRHSASYTSIAPGRYVFRVKGANNDGVWNDTGASLQIVIHPPFWQTWWFRLLLAAVAIALVLLVIRVRTRAVELQKRELERLVEERTRDLRQKNERLGRINTLVESINSQLDFDRVLAMMLGITDALHDVETAIALVLDPAAGLFRAKAALGWDPEAIEDLAMTADDIARTYLAEADELSPDIFVADLSARSAAPLTLLILRLRTNEQVDGFLIFESPRRKSDLAADDIQLMADLKGHVLSAFTKAKVLEQLARLNEQKNEFVGIAAHDLRSPLGVIAGWVTIVIDHIKEGRIDNAREIRFLEGAKKAVETMDRLVHDLLDISAIESGKISLDRSDFDISGLIQETVANSRAAAAQKDISLTICDVANLPALNADVGRIGEVLDNLVTNAIKYTHRGGAIRISCERLDAEIVTHIEDNGQGLGEEDMKSIFKTFKRLSARPTAGESSTGLGLAIVKKIIDLHGGSIWVTSAKGHGARFSFSLPVEKTVAEGGPSMLVTTG